MLVSRFENYLFETYDYYNYSNIAYNEWLISDVEEKDDNRIATTKGNYLIETPKQIYSTEFVVLYKHVLFSHNRLIFTRFKTSKFYTSISANIISIVQKNNISHKSAEEISTLFC